VNFGGGALQEAASTSLPWAIAVALVVGKIVGISAAVWLALRTGLGRLPQGVSGLHVVAVAAVAGIGFTVSLFIADLAYDDPALTETAKIGIFAGSLFAAAIGSALMFTASRHRASATASTE
jgi:NhaA family Na+:H+ antiporter